MRGTMMCGDQSIDVQTVRGGHGLGVDIQDPQLVVVEEAEDARTKNLKGWGYRETLEG
jgi:hypothetical protein